MADRILNEAALNPQIEPLLNALDSLQQVENEPVASATSRPQMLPARETLPRYLARIYDAHLATDETKLALFEPRRVMTPDGYHSTKCAASGLYSLLEQAQLAAQMGHSLPTEITGSTFSYRVLEHNVPVYFVSEELARAVAATELPADFTFADLHWPQLGMVIGWPPWFMKEFTNREICYIYCANCPEGQYWLKGRPDAPVIEVPEGKSKVGWFYYTWAANRIECFVSAYYVNDKLAGFTDYTYTDYMGEEAAKIQADKELTERVSSLTLKLLVILNMQPSLVTHGTQERPQRVKHGKVVRRELWSANFIGRGYHLARERTGTHASPRLHIRRGHITWQVIGSRTSGDFFPARALARDEKGGIDWTQVKAETRAQFLRCHKRLWLQPILIGAKEQPERER